MRFNDINETTAWENYILRLDKDAEKLAERSAKAQITVEEKRALYLDALKDVKAIEKLKEKQQKEYRKEMLDYQMAEVDDLTAARIMSI
jgi:flagellar export protein FliJ